MRIVETIETADDRGFSLSFKYPGLKHFHIVSVKPGATRGNHFHEHDEVLCVLGGENLAKITLQDPQSSREFLVDTERSIIRIPAGVKHSITNTGGKTFYLVCFSDSTSSR
ncbi:MAG: cupin domain-containing protein [wastewater metagenome]|nr:cupin domain-containing protein [Candidatus Loosdrechtia aerotolerans]